MDVFALTLVKQYIVNHMANKFELIQVECYAGYKANETPRVFIWQVTAG